MERMHGGDDVKELNTHVATEGDFRRPNVVVTPWFPARSEPRKANVAGTLRILHERPNPLVKYFTIRQYQSVPTRSRMVR
jgi:hypothetical protein